MVENIQIRNKLFRQEVFFNYSADEEIKSVNNMQRTIKVLGWITLVVFIGASFSVGLYLYYFPHVLSYVL